MGMMLATGGKQATAGSLMCKHGVNLKLIREDNTDKMQEPLATFAEGAEEGRGQPERRARTSSPSWATARRTFLKGAQRQACASSAPSTSRWSSAPPATAAARTSSWARRRGRQNPQAARGGLVAGVLRDGDWNIALKWLGDNKIPNNPDETTYDPDALNWVNASDYIEAAQKYVSGYCADLKNAKTGKKEKHCVNGVVTWTPGDVTVAEQKGGLVSIVSTQGVPLADAERHHRQQEVDGGEPQDRRAACSRRSSRAATRSRPDDEALQQAAAVSALVYKEKDAAYWYKYFKRRRCEKDKQGADGRARRLGGEQPRRQPAALRPRAGLGQRVRRDVHGLRRHREVAVPEPRAVLLPGRRRCSTRRTCKELAAAGADQERRPTCRSSQPDEKVKQVVSRRVVGHPVRDRQRHVHARGACSQLKSLFNDLVVASGTLVEIHGHTDNQGTADANMTLSEDSARSR